MAPPRRRTRRPGAEIQARAEALEFTALPERAETWLAGLLLLAIRI